MILKTILDYYEDLYKEYPEISKSDIKRIVNYGLRSLYLHNSYGGDTLVMQLGFWCYCGLLMNDSLKYFEYYKKKMRIKLRVYYKRKKVLWDNYYYFALTPRLYNAYLALKNKRGRPRTKFTFSNVFIYKIYDECSIVLSNRVAIFRIPALLDLGFTIFKKELKTDSAELILIREPLKFDDILLTKYNYQFINTTKKRLYDNNDR